MLVSPLFNRVRTDPVHDEVSKSVVKLWISFIKEGYLHSPKISLSTKVTKKQYLLKYFFNSLRVPSATYGSERNFPPIDPDVGLQKFYRLDTDTELMDNIFAERIAFWESLDLSDDDFGNCYC